MKLKLTCTHLFGDQIKRIEKKKNRRIEKKKIRVMDEKRNGGIKS